MSQNINQFVTLPARTTTASPTTLLSTDGVLNYNKAGAVALTLPALAGVRGRLFYVRNQDGTGAVTITPAPGETINGAGTYIMAVSVPFPKGAITLYAPPTGTDWLVLSQTPL